MSTVKIRAAIESLTEEKFILPNFQREYTYDRSKQKELIASILTFIPIGAIMTLEGDPNLMSYRNIGRRSSVGVNAVNQRSVKFVLDGQQRLTTIWACFTDVFDSLSLTARDELRENLSPKLLSRWHLRIVPVGNEDDVFGWKWLELRMDQLRALSPEDIESRIGYDKSLVNNDIWPWVDGAVMELPPLITNDPHVASRRQRIETEGLIPIHKLLNCSSFVRAIGRFRVAQLTKALSSLYDTKSEYSKCSIEERELLVRLLGVSDSKSFDMFCDAVFRQAELESRLDNWLETLNRYFHAIFEQLIFNVELAQSDLQKANVIFDVINQTGERLTMFDLFCAKHPNIDIRMRLQDVLDGYPEHLGLVTRDRVPEKKFLDLFMNTLRALYHAKNNSGQTWKFAQAIKEDVLTIDGNFVHENLDLCVKAVANAVVFANNSLGVRRLSETPYLLQLLPIAMGFALSGNAPSSRDHSYLEYVYWFSLFSGRYREAQNKTVGDDIEYLVEHLVNLGPLHPTYSATGPWAGKILDYEGYNDKEHLIANDKDEPVGESVKKSIVQFILAQCPVDFPVAATPVQVPALSASTEHLELHHIVPLATQATVYGSAKALKKAKGPINSPLNLTFISKESNRFLGPLPLLTYINYLDPDALIGHCLHAGTIIPHNVNAPGQLNNWLEGRYNAIRMTVQTKLGMLRNQICAPPSSQHSI